MKQLRPYQSKAISSALQANGECIITMATGLGKTVTAVELAKNFTSTLFVVDSEELAEQAANAFRYDFKETGLIKADKFEVKRITVASIQTLYRRLDKLTPEQFELIIVDECHGYMARQWRRGIEYFSPKLRCGITATPARLDNLSLSDLFGDIVYEYNIKSGIEDGYLVELDAIKIKTNVSLDKINTVAGELNQGQLSNEINTLARNNQVSEAYVKYAKGRRTIVFCCNIKHALDLCDVFLMKGIKATAISSDEEQTGDRTEKVKDFKEGKYDVIFNCNILSKGFDLPIVSCIINASPTKSLTRFMQGIGRGTRPLTGVIDGIETVDGRWKAIKSSDKKDCLIIDIVDNTTRHNIVNAWNLDRELPPEERVFITQENRDKLIEARLNKIHKLEHTRESDERVSLLRIPRLKVNLNTENMQKDATQPQLDWISKLGHNIKDNHYSNGDCQEILNQQPLSKTKKDELRAMGYDVDSRPLINADYNAVQREIWIKKQKKLKK